MKRVAHWLTHNKGSEYPRDVVIVDTETNEIELGDGLKGHRLAFGWAFYARRVRGDVWEAQQWFRFDSMSAFWTWCLRRCRARGRLTLYAHNVEFDGQVLDCFGEMHRRRWRLRSACLEGPPTLIQWRRGSRTVQFLDTLNLWRVPLSAIGEKVGLPKLDMPGKWTGAAGDDVYCRRDVEILWRALQSWWAFLRANDLGNAAATLAGQAFNSYRHRFMHERIYIDIHKDALALARSAYFGGRCECFRLGVVDEPGVTLDVNSMYPAVMRTLLAPTRLLTYRTRATVADLERYLSTYALTADVDLMTDKPAYPCLIDGRLCFPVGCFRVALASPELSLALAHGHVKHVHSVAVYERAELFREFVEWEWQARRDARAAGDSLLDWQIKILANSLYGKFGQRGRRWEMIGECGDYAVRVQSSYDLDRGVWRHLRQLGTALQELRDGGESMHSHPAIAAHVTSAARLKLWGLIGAAGAGQVWYCDTDSLKGPRALLNRLAGQIDANLLGALKHEDSFPWIELRGPKDYSTPATERHKGVRAAAEPFLWGAYLQAQWFGWAGSIRRGSLNMPLVGDTVKVLERRYLKGRVSPGGQVTPLVLA